MADKPRRVIVAGHSHADTLFGHALRAAVEPTLFKLDENAEVYGLVGAFPRRPEYWRVLEREARDSAVVILWAGNDHNGLFLFELTPKFDFVRDDTPWVDESAELVPAALVERMFATLPHVEECMSVLRGLAQVRSCWPMLAEPPPPKGDDHALREFIVSEFAAIAQARGIDAQTAGLTHPNTRLKLWRAMCDAQKAMARDAGVGFLPLPEWVFDEGGFLKREYWHTDATHANLAYSKAVNAYLGEHLLR